jgi:F-box and WD-40 domain protein 1/11
MATTNTSPRQILPSADWSSAEATYLDEPAASSASAYSNDTGTDGVEKDALEPFRPATANPFHRTKSITSSIPWRRRPKSLILSFEDGTMPAEKSVNPAEGSLPDTHNDGARQVSSLKGKIRRASLSLMKGIVHRRDRRSSEPGSVHDDHESASRPTTAHSTWHKLRQATSFRHSKMLCCGRGHSLETIYSPLQSSFTDVTVPGNGLEPPIIPTHTGHAAKASAALQNEYIAFARQREEWLAEQVHNDGESGIGIALSTAGEVEPSTAAAALGTPVSKVDFISRLPSELAVQILSHLDATHLASVARVSKAWNQIHQDQYIWRDSFLREKTATFATSEPCQPGSGLGVPAIRPGTDWHKTYKAKQELERKWKEGTSAQSVYLNGHLDSIYCLQFDEYVPSIP